VKSEDTRETDAGAYAVAGDRLRLMSFRDAHGPPTGGPSGDGCPRIAGECRAL